MNQFFEFIINVLLFVLICTYLTGMFIELREKSPVDRILRRKK